MIMGIINISPESFFPESYVKPLAVREIALKMIDSGADLIDIGARSTAIGSKKISLLEEKNRVISALKEIEDLNLTITLDTMYPEVLSEALTYGVDALNDISGLVNPDMAKIVTKEEIPAVLMATRKTPGDCLNFSDTRQALDMVVKRCADNNIDEYVLDPGIGRWLPERTFEADFEVCRRFHELLDYDRPLIAAVSRKSFIGDAVHRNVEDRLAGTLAATSALILSGASLIRTHDIVETLDLVNVLMQIKS